MEKPYSRQIDFEAILNFRDLGGYRTADGRTVAWRHIFRGGNLLDMTTKDKARLREELGLKTVIDLRNPSRQQRQRETDLLQEIGVEYLNIPFRTSNKSFLNEKKIYACATDISQIYLYRVKRTALGKRLVKALETISDREKHPVLFHCGIGKDRTGILTAFLLTLLGVSDDDIITEYSLSDPFMEEIRNRIVNNPATPQNVKNQPDFDWRARPESMESFLRALRKDYGSVTKYLISRGMAPELVEELRKALLV